MHILVVDDDPDIGTMLSRFLEKEGYRVTVAGDGVRALELVEEEFFGLIITDYMMPLMDGIAFAEKTRDNPRLKGVPVILLTAYGTPDVQDRGLRRGVAMTLSKPVDLGRLLTLVKFSES